MSLAERYAAFISYAHRYQGWVAALQRNLETCLQAASAEVSDVFLDTVDLATGRSWVAQLQEGLAKSRHLILVATPETLASPRVEDEWDSFVARRPDWGRGGFHVVSLLDVPLPPFLDRIQRLDFVDHDDEGYRSALRQLVGGLLGLGRREHPALPDGLEIPDAPSDALPRELRSRLVDWLVPHLERKAMRPAVAEALGVPRTALEGQPTPQVAASAALVTATGDDDRVQAARRVVRALLDTFDEEEPARLAELRALGQDLERLGQDGGGGLLAAWLERVARDNENLVPLFDHAHLELLDRVYVQLELRPEVVLARDKGSRDKDGFVFGPGRQDLTLRDLLALERGEHAWVTHRWVVRGDPGAGKTTLLRHLAATLATETPRRFVPVFESLPRLMREPEFLLERLERQMTRAGSQVKGLAAALDREAREGRLLLLLDGLDEVPRERRDETESLLRDFSTRWPRTPLVVTSRPIGYRRPGSEFVELELLPFDGERRRELLSRWFGRAKAKADRRRAAAVMKVLAGDPGLWDLSGNPLYLTLMALLFEQGQEPDRNRAKLYEQVFDLLLDGRHRGAGEPIPAKDTVYAVLRRLACEMTKDNHDAEPRGEIETRLYDPGHDRLRDRLERVPPWRRGLGSFLDDLAEKTGILGPHDGSSADWRYWHRTFREALTAEQLATDFAAGGEARILERAREVEGDESRWAEPFALLVGRVEDPDALVRSLVEANRALGLRAVATAQRLSDETLREILNLTDDWEKRRDVYLQLPELIDDPERALALVDQLRRRTRDGNDLYFLWETAVTLGEGSPDVERMLTGLLQRFFDHLPAPEEGFLPWVEIPEGEGWIGAADGEYDYDDERPRHRVRVVAPFEMAATPVTNQQYAVFDDTHRWEEWEGVSGEELAHHPVVKVTWYAAVAFCRWLAGYFPGARLPTEEEWEYACRAGTETRYWSGDGEADLARVGWYDENSGDENSAYRTHRVGEKPANSWKLHDMHGNAWEWTLTEWAEKPYAGRENGFEVDPRADLAAASRGGGRVFRGGSFWYVADRTRAACRDWDVPWARDLLLGFRVLRPRP